MSSELKSYIMNFITEKVSNMDPTTAQRLFAEGRITQETLDAVMAKNEVSFDAPVDMLDRQAVAPAPLVAPAEPIMTPSVPVTPPLAPGVASPVTSPMGAGALSQTAGQATTETSEEKEKPTTKNIVTGKTITTIDKQKEATEGAKKAQADLESSFEQAKNAEAQKAEIDRQMAVEKFNYGKQEQKILADASAVEQDVRNEGQRELEERLDALDTMTADLSEREYKGYWSNKSTGDKILGAISLAMGAYGSAVSGGSNTALSIINGAMDRDFAQFKDVTDNKIKAINSSRLNVNTKRNLIQSQLAGLQAKREADILQIQKKVGNLSNKFADPTHKAKLADLGAQLEQKRAESRLKFEKGLEKEVGTTTTQKVEAIQIDADGNVVAPDRATKEEIKLSESYRRHPTIQAFDKISAQFGKIKSAQDTAAGDLSLIFSYMKILDPGSVVREGEFATAQNAGGIDDTLANIYNNVASGERLTDSQRKEFTAQAEKLMQAQADDSDRIRVQFTEEAKRLGLNPDRIVPAAPEAPKTIVQQLYSKSRNQTKVIYSDGTEEIRDGR
jgi:hypothetical protein